MMKVLGAAVALALPVAVVNAALSVDSSTSTDEMGGFLQKTWSLKGDAVNALTLDVAGNIFVEFDASLRNDSGLAAKVVMKSSSANMLDLVDITPSDIDNGFRLHYKNVNARVMGEVVTQITLSDHNTVDSLAASVADNVVVGGDVLVSNDDSASLRFTARGDSDLFLGSTHDAFSLNDLKIASSGDGRVQFLASSIQANGIDLSLSGDGKAAVVAAEEIVVDSITSSISGDGKVFVESANVQADTLIATLTGDGKLAYATAGSCENQRINLSGDGSVYAGPIVCKDTYVATSGDSKAMVQTTGTLTTVGHGKVKYLGEPQHIVSKSHWRKHSKVKEARYNKVKTYSVRMPPSKTPTNLRIILRAAWFGDSPHVSVHWGWPYGGPTHHDPWGHGWDAMELSVDDKEQPLSFGLLAFFAAASVLAFISYKYHKRHAQEYAPLL